MNDELEAPKLFRLSPRSYQRLGGVHPDLVRVVEYAIEWTLVDFRITEGVRTLERQKELVKAGKSKTMNSRHLSGKAVDVAAVLNGVVKWELVHYGGIAEAFGIASRKTGIPIVWGAVWDRHCGDLGDPLREVDRYAQRRRARGLTPFIDGPHFELCRVAYP